MSSFSVQILYQRNKNCSPDSSSVELYQKWNKQPHSHVECRSGGSDVSLPGRWWGQKGNTPKLFAKCLELGERAWRGWGWAVLSQVTRLCSVPLVGPQLLLGKQLPPSSPSATRPPVPLSQTILSWSAEAVNHAPSSSCRPDLHCYFEEDTLESYELMKLKKKLTMGEEHSKDMLWYLDNQ